MEGKRHDFIEWMKCLGIVVIVYGHVAGSTINYMTVPINAKQIGVALFVFVTGYTLAAERRAPWSVVYNRLFELTLFGLTAALLMTCLDYAKGGRGALSNYEPFVFGANVVLNYFPANPTTWFIGTYFHFLVLWALVLRRVRIHLWVIVAWLVAEVAIRAALAATAGPYVAYMAAPNWMAPFLLGMYCRQQSAQEVRGSVVPWLLALAAFVVCWARFAPTPTRVDFPFMVLGTPGELSSRLATSAAVTTLYLAYTLLIFQMSRRAPSLAPVRFIARNTAIIFLWHMPVFYALGAIGVVHDLPAWPRIGIEFTICFFVLALLSEIVRALIDPPGLRDRLAARLTRRWQSLDATDRSLSRRSIADRGSCRDGRQGS